MYNNSRTVAMVSYITWIGWIIAFLIRDKTDRFAAHHLNQALCVNLIETIGTILGTMGIAAVSEIVDMVAFVLWIIGIFRAIRGSRQPLPIIGNIEWIR